MNAICVGGQCSTYFNVTSLQLMYGFTSLDQDGLFFKLEMENLKGKH